MLKDPRFPLAEVMSALKAIDEQAVESVENETSMSDGEKHDKERQLQEATNNQDEQP